MEAIKHEKHGEERAYVVFERKLNTLAVSVHISKITTFCVNLEHSIRASKKGNGGGFCLSIRKKLVTMGAVHLETIGGLRYNSLNQYGLFYGKMYTV